MSPPEIVVTVVTSLPVVRGEVRLDRDRPSDCRRVVGEYDNGGVVGPVTVVVILVTTATTVVAVGRRQS